MLNLMLALSQRVPKYRVPMTNSFSFKAMWCANQNLSKVTLCVRCTAWRGKEAKYVWAQVFN